MTLSRGTVDQSPLLVARLAGSSEAFGLSTACEALHVGDLAVADGEDLVSLLSPARRVQASGGDDDVVADLPEFGLDVERLVAAFSALELQDLTGLVRTASGRCLFPPEVSVRDAPPLRVCVEQGDERLEVSAIQSLGGTSKFVEHVLGGHGYETV